MLHIPPPLYIVGQFEPKATNVTASVSIISIARNGIPNMAVQAAAIYNECIYYMHILSLRAMQIYGAFVPCVGLVVRPTSYEV